MHTTQQTFNSWGSRPIIIAVKVNGGSIVIEKPVGSDWVTADTITTDGAVPVWLGCGKYRVTPSNGAAFEIS